MRTSLLLLLPLLGCQILPVECDLMAIASVSLTVVDESGAPVPGAVATWSVDGGEFQDCDAMSDSGFACGWEVAGEFTLRVDAPGYEAWEGSAVVEADQCHVIPEVVEAVLTVDADCTDVEIPSVIVTVEGSSGEELTDVQVGWTPTGTDQDQACEPYGKDGDWVCGWEVAGPITVWAVASGHGEQRADVVVEADECHVITEQVTLLLDWLPD